MRDLGVDAFIDASGATPAVVSGIEAVVSGSGETPVSPHFARSAAQLGARTLAVTAQPHSPLASLADDVLPVPNVPTEQFGDSLFE